MYCSSKKMAFEIPKGAISINVNEIFQKTNLVVSILIF